MAETYSNPSPDAPTEEAPSSAAAVALRWLIVGLPLAWGIFETLKKSLALFH